MACELWKYAEENNISILLPQWIGTGDNDKADFLSRHSLDHWEFYLNRDIFSFVLETYSVFPTLDAFASQDTCRLPRYMTWFEDQHAVARDALLHPWDKCTYLFPPVPLLPRVIQKVREENIRAVLIVPHWPSALWWPHLMEMMEAPPLFLPHYKEALTVMRQSQELPYLEPLVALHLLGTQ